MWRKNLKNASRSRPQSRSSCPPIKSVRAVEMSASFAGRVAQGEPRVCEAVPDAAAVLSADDLRQWARASAVASRWEARTRGSNSFSETLLKVSPIVPQTRARLLFQICIRQLVLSSSTSLATYDRVPAIAAAIDDEEFLAAIFKLAADIAQRSAKHSAEFVEKCLGRDARVVESFDDQTRRGCRRGHRPRRASSPIGPAG